MGRTIAPRFPEERLQQPERIYLTYLRTIQRLRDRTMYHFRRSRRKKDGWTQIGQALTNRLYIYIYCLIPINCIVALIEQRKFDDTIL